MPASAVLGCGRHLPARRVRNDELGTDMGVPAAELAALSGITVRHHADTGQGPSHLAREAALGALADAGLAPADVELIVFATMTPDLAFPGSGCILQDQLGCGTVGAIELRAQCAGFLFALATADRFVRASAASRVLVAGADVHSTALDYSRRAAHVTPCFGDGAGAVILGPGLPGLLAVVLHSDPTDLERFWCEFPASRHHPSRMNREAFDAGAHFYRFEPDALHPQAERALADVTAEVLARADVSAERIALHLVHYVDPRVARRAADRAGISPDRVVATAEAAAHIASAGIPIALADARATGRVGPGDLVSCAAFGAGMSWAAAVVRL